MMGEMKPLIEWRFFKIRHRDESESCMLKLISHNFDLSGSFPVGNQVAH